MGAAGFDRAGRERPNVTEQAGQRPVVTEQAAADRLWSSRLAAFAYVRVASRIRWLVFVAWSGMVASRGCSVEKGRSIAVGAADFDRAGPQRPNVTELGHNDRL
ncbi:hypothetical protein D9V28_13190 [Mycetocola zhadangensis]|uniref:Uncharacterized protein n=1 Tax=Mycetocola zhadangensis TaxID=1164595 RepID=A0A3L7ISV2_9MICO|nr:hypothetical protein D9V28_13190 [Mycetocola zhadangensis]